MGTSYLLPDTKLGMVIWLALSALFLGAKPASERPPGPTFHIENTTACDFDAVVFWRTDCSAFGGVGQSPVLVVPDFSNNPYNYASYTLPNDREIVKVEIRKHAQLGAPLTTWTCGTGTGSWTATSVANGCGVTTVLFGTNDGITFRIDA